MKKQYTRLYADLPRGIGILCLTFAMLLFAQQNLRAQQNVPVTGYNSDQVANGIGAPTTSSTAGTDGGVDGGGYVFIDATYQYNNTCALATTNIVPASNLINSQAAPGLTYVLQPYSGNNALRVPATGVTAGTGTLNVTTPVSAGTLYLLCVAGGGAIPSGVTITVTFTDLSTQVFTNRSAEDWCNTANLTGYTKITTTNYNRILAPTTTGCGNFATCQYFAEMALAIDPANQAKTIASITVNKTATTCVMNVYAVGMLPPCAAPVAQPTALISTLVSTGFINGAFTAASPAASGYLVVRYPQGATPTAPVSGTSYTAGQALGAGTVVQASSATTFTTTGLTPGTPYDFYVYSYFGPCSPLTSSPTYLTTTPLTTTITTSACGGSINGTLGVGPGQTYINLTAALAAIASGGISGPTVLELTAGYDPTSETYPITFQGDPCASNTKTITIRPAAGTLVPVVISSNSATATIDLNGAKYITFDGRAGGTGTPKLLSIVNTNNAGVAIRFANDASYNTIKFCDVQGQNTSSTTGAASAQVGVISFWTANTVTQNGNDSNTISYCDIHATSTGFPAIGIASWGNSAVTPASAWNDYNTIDHCNIYDFFSATLASTGIKADGGSNRYTVSNNHVYQTASRTYTTANNHRAFWLTPTATGAGGFTVTNNFIGGNDSLGAGTYTMLGGAVATNFWGMDINHAGTIHSSVQGNTITSISLTNTSTTSNIFRGISTGGVGHMDIGTIVGNTIGSATTNGAITLSNNSTGSTAYGIVCGGTAPDSVTINNNTIAGITTGSLTANISVHIMAIGITSGNYASINNNLVGSYTNANSLSATNAVTSNPQSICGIIINAGTYSVVNNNTIINLTNYSVSTSTSTTTTNPSYTRGISMNGSTTSIITGNKVKNVASGAISTGSGASAPLTGIVVNTSNTATVTGNMVDSLVLMPNTSANASNLDGMLIGLNGSVPTHVIAKNFVHHLMTERPGSSAAVINGINIIGGSTIVANNMIQLGLRVDGTTYDTSMTMRGLYLNTTTATNVFHNTVYLGGTNVLNNAKQTYAFARGAASGTHQVRNNVFVNERSNATTGGKHYQVFLNTTTGLSITNNVYYGTGTGSVFGSSNNGTSDVASITSGWINIDSNSVSANPRFITPNGGSLSSASPVNLHIDPVLATPVESAGIPIASITDDYDGNIRSSNTPVDIGADAGLFTLIGMTIDSTSAEQVVAGTLIGATNQAVIAVKIYTKGLVNPLQLTALKLNTAGTTNAADLASAKVYYTGGSNTFGTATPFGSAVVAPNGTFYVSGLQTLSGGVNYFWVAYDVSATAVAGNFIDARLDSVGLSGNVSGNILVGNPAGSRKISAPLSGNYTVGLGQNYATIAAAITDLNLLGVSAPVTFTLMSPTYSVATGETFPIVLAPYFGASAVNTVTFMPGPGVTASIVDNVGTPMFRIDGGKYYRIDGRQAGSGTPKSLTIQNNSTSGSALNFINDASFNIMRYTIFRGSSTVNTTGVINFGPGITTGNDSNTIEYCNIGDGATLPTTLVQARGSVDVATKFNNGNVIDNCELFNFWHLTTESNAFKISKGNTDWKITNNSIYQTASRKFASIHYTFNWNRIVDDASNLDDAMAQASLNNMVITGNYFGGSAAQCGGAPWTQDSSAGQFCSYFNVGASVNSTFKQNTFTNFNVTSISAFAGSPGVWNAIQFVGGKLDIDSNLIGSVSDTGAIRVTAAGGATVFPIAVTGAAAGTYSIKGNRIGGISAGGRGPASINLYNIFVSTGSATTFFNIDYNNIGVAGIYALPSSSTTAQLLYGINNTGSGILNIRNNIIHNLYNQQSVTGTSQTIGIRTSLGTDTITGNLIDSLDNTTAQLGTAANAATIGIAFLSTTGNSLISRNTIYSVGASHATEAVAVTGIYYAGGTGDVVSRNLIHSLNTVSSSATSLQVGIQTNGGTARIHNNMIRLGINASGQPQTVSPVLNGISMSGGNSRVFFNSVYIGGTGVLGASNTFALTRTGTGTDSLYNNILVNERNGGTGVHYAVSLSGNTNLKANTNLYYVGAGPTLGLFNNLPQATIGNWKSVAGVDAGSNAGNPSYSNPMGDLATLNLHIGGTTPVEGSGLQINGINDDFDGDSRSGLTPTDIGADAGNFILSDIFAPSISYTAIQSDTVHTALVLTGFATITDPSTVDVGFNIPRLYYKKSTDNNTFGGNTAFDNGWKYVTASNTTSPFSFTIDYTIISGGSVVPQDTIQYFVAAQDALNNVGANPGAGFSAATVTSVFTAPSVPAFYRIKRNPLNGPYNVGVGQTAPNFATLTAATFALGDVGVGSPVTFNLLDASYSAGETFPLTVNAIQGASATNTVTIKPATGVTSTISGSNGTAIFILNGADYLTIDGSNAGSSSMDLTISNTNTAGTAAVIWGQTATGNDGATNNTIKNTNVIGAGRTNTLVGIGFGGNTVSVSGLGTGNNNNTINNCLVTAAQYGIYDMGASAANKNQGLTITNNRINVNSKAGIYAGFQNNINISANKISDVTNGNTAYGITLGTVNGNTTTITGNEVSNVTISKNIIDSINSSSTWTTFGISVVNSASAGTTNITNNMITRIIGTGTASDFTSGMYVGGGALTTTNIYYNTINLTTPLTGSSRAFAIALDGNNSVMNVKNNIFINQMSGTSAGTYAIGVNYGTFTNLDENYNNYISTGTTAAFAVTGGIFGAGTDQASLAAWRTATGKGANSKNVAVNFTSASDAHLTGASNGDFNLAGTPVAGITTDIDGNGRHVTYPYMGADEASTPLPVDLLVFAAQAKKGDVLLSWVTASEQNNKGFDVERSVDGKTFAKVDFVKGAGNSARTITYSTTDANAFAAAGARVLYYRLKQVDQNGRYTYSKTVLVSTDSKAEAAAPVAYPNPFTSDLSVTFNAPSAATAHLELLDMGGRVVRSQDVKVTEGMNGAVLTDMSFVQQGLYFLKVTINDHSFMIKVNKQ